MRNFARSFIPLYMFVLINFAKRTMKPVDPEDFAVQYFYWESGVFDGIVYRRRNPGDSRSAVVWHRSVSFQYSNTASPAAST